MSEEFLWTLAFVGTGLIALTLLALFCVWRSLFDWGDV